MNIGHFHHSVCVCVCVRVCVRVCVCIIRGLGGVQITICVSKGGHEKRVGNHWCMTSKNHESDGAACSLITLAAL